MALRKQKAEEPSPAEAGPVVTVGRVVHYRAEGGEPLAAVVTAVHADGTVDLVVFPPMDEPRSAGLVRKGSRPGSWTWPPRV